MRRLALPVRWGLLALALSTSIAASATGPGDPEAPRIEAAVRDAINDVLDAGTFKTPGWRGGRLDAATVEAIHRELDRRLEAHMTGPALAAWRGALHAAIDRDSDGEHVVVTAGGADEVEFETVETDGDSAGATGRAHVWVTWTILGGDAARQPGARPGQWDAFSATLVRKDGRWFVETLRLEPEAGR